MRILLLCVVLWPPILPAMPSGAPELVEAVAPLLPYVVTDQIDRLPAVSGRDFGNLKQFRFEPEPGVYLRFHELPNGHFGLTEITVTTMFSRWDSLREILAEFDLSDGERAVVVSGAFSQVLLPAATAENPSIRITLFWC